jgi:hypothetical protein
MKGELADESLGAFHGDTNGRSFGTLIPFNAKHFCYRRRHNDLISTGVYESQELARLVSTRDFYLNRMQLRGGS